MKTASFAAILALAFLASSCDNSPAPLLGEDFSSWTEITTEPITLDIPGHGGSARRIFINDIGTKVTTHVEGTRTVWDYPDGTIILKTTAAFLPDGSPGTTTMLLGMVKDPGNRLSQGDWVWVTRDPSTGAERIFDTEFCITCHVDANETRTVDDPVPVGVPNPDREFREFVFYPYYAPR